MAADSENSFDFIERHYRLRIRRVKAYHTIYKGLAAYRAETDRGVMLIKPYKGYARKLERVASWQERLQKNGYRQVPRWMKTSEGKPYLQHHGNLYYVTDWIPGRHIEGEERELYELGKALGKLHALSGGFGLKPALQSPVDHLQSQYTRFLKQVDKGKGQDSDAGRWFRAKEPEWSEMCRKAFQILNLPEIKACLNKERIHPPLVHGDITSANVINTGEGIVLIDWELMERGSGYYELAKSLTNTTGFSPHKMSAFLRGYEQKKRLDRVERMTVYGLYRLPREAWYAAAELHADGGSSLQKIVEKTWENRLDAIRWMKKWARA